MNYDVIVVGGGPGGYVAAIRCAQLGLKTACVEKWIGKSGQPSLGGTCLNVGCIPSKSWLETSEHYEIAKDHSDEFGFSVTGVSANIPKMLERKDKIVNELTSGIAGLFKANKIDWIQGKARLIKDKQVEVTLHEGSIELHQAKNIILATGSVPVAIPTMPLVDQIVVDSEGALDWDSVPETLCVIGAGVIGLELGSVWRRLGAKVTVLQRDGFLEEVDAKLAGTAGTAFKKQGLAIKVQVQVKSIEVKKGQAQVTFEEKDQEIVEIFDRVIVAVGRKPYTDGLLSDDCGVSLNDWGQIEVDELCETQAKGIYAVGDAVRGTMLAHKASEEGVVVAERIAGQKPHLNYDAIPMVIYTEPEIAWVGKTEQNLKDANVDYNSGEFPFAANGRAKTAGNTVGLVKVLADAKTDRILGVHMIGGKVSELIGQAVIAIELEASSEDLSRMVFAHPSLSESVHEAMLAVDGRAIHAVNRKK